MNNSIISKYLKENNYQIPTNYSGITLKEINNELVISGSSKDLIELADYLVNLAISPNEEHLHLDDLTLLNKESNPQSIIIEKINRE